MHSNVASVLSSLSSNPSTPAAAPVKSDLRADLKAQLTERYAGLSGAARADRMAADLRIFSDAAKAAEKTDKDLARAHRLAAEIIRDIDCETAGFGRKVAVLFGGRSPSELQAARQLSGAEVRHGFEALTGEVQKVGASVEAGRSENRWGMAFLGAAVAATLAAASRGADAAETAAETSARHVDHAVDAPVRNAKAARAAYDAAVKTAADAAEALGAATREHLEAERAYRKAKTTLNARALLRAEAAREVAQEDLAGAEQALIEARAAAEKFRGV